MFKAYNSLSVGRRLSLITFAISAVTLIIVIYLALVSTTQTIRTEKSQLLIEGARTVASRVDTRFARVNDILISIAAELRGRPSYTADDVESAVAQVMRYETNLIVRRISFYQPNMPLMSFHFSDASSGRSYNITRFAEDKTTDTWFNRISRTSGGWYGPYTSLFENNSDPILSYPLYITLGQQSAVLWADVSVSTFQNVMREVFAEEQLVKAGDNGFALLTNENGVLLAEFNTARRAPSDIEPLLARAFIAPTNAISGAKISANEPMYTVKTPLNRTNWYLIPVLPESVLPALPVETASQVILVSALGLLVLIIVILFFVNRTVSIPLNELATGALEIGSGDMRYTISYKDKADEIGQLARALEDMRDNLRYSYDTLEQRIERRTAELDIARAKAQHTAEELRAVYDASLSVVNEYQLQAILDTLVSRLVVMLKAEYCAVWLLRSNREELRLVAHTREEPPQNMPFIKMGTGIVGKSAQQREPIVLDSYSTWSERLAPLYSQGLERVMAVPLISSGVAIGALEIGRYKGATFHENEVRLLTLFANLVAPSIRNAQLYHELDEARRAADRASHVKTRFLASVTHELRTPLNLIINNMDFMRIGAFGDVNEEQSARLGQTIRSAEHLLYLINDLLDVSKIDAGEMELFIQEADPYIVIEDALDSVMLQLEKDGKDKYLALTADIEEHLPFIPMDARRIRQVLHNLLSNAVKFTIAGEVRFSVKRVGEHVLFAVSDTGIGIPECERGALFEAFERTNHSKQHGIEGTGLGLAISRYLVRKHGSELEFVTQENKGTTFWFSLPLNARINQSVTRTNLNAAIQSVMLSTDEHNA